MGEISFDHSDKEQEAQSVASNTPLMIALACAFLLVGLFIAVMESNP